MTDMTDTTNKTNTPTQLQSYKDFLEYLNDIGSETTTEEELFTLYNEYVEIEFNHHKVSIPFNAVIYNELINLITTMIKEYYAMNKNPSLNIGITYHTDTGIAVTPIKTLPNQRALFVTNKFYPTPFVVWSYSLSPTDPTLISLYSGSYYTTLDKAIEAESDGPEPMRLELSLYCPDCEELYHYTFSCDGTVQDLLEQIEDARVRCPECGYLWMGIHKIAIADNDTTYDLPIWYGPVLEE